MEMWDINVKIYLNQVVRYFNFIKVYKCHRSSLEAVVIIRYSSCIELPYLAKPDLKIRGANA